MDRTELKEKLEPFKTACSERNYIDANYENALFFEEAYPNVIPTSFIVNVILKNQSLVENNVLKELTSLLWANTDAKTRENIFTLNIMTVEEQVNSERTRDRELAVTHPDLNSEQMKKLFHDKKRSVQQELINFLTEGKLTKQQILQALGTEERFIINLLNKRYNDDTNFRDSVNDTKELKYKFMTCRL